jgi:hypothetical protein
MPVYAEDHLLDDRRRNLVHAFVTWPNGLPFSRRERWEHLPKCNRSRARSGRLQRAAAWFDIVREIITV